MAKRGKSRRRKSLQSVAYLWIGILLIIGVAGVSISLFLLKPEKIEKDPLTLCPVKNGPSAFTSIVIDRTDSFGSISKADVEVELQDILDSTKEYEEISLFVVEPVEKSPLRSIISVCNPGTPDKADPWTQNPELVAKNWKTKFLTPLGDLLNRLLVEEEAPLSPIMESIQSVSITALGGSQKSSLPRRIILISDLLQNSQAWSLYTQNPDFEAFSEAKVTRGLNPDLRGVSNELLFLQRETKIRIDEKKLLRFWIQWIEFFGGRVTRVLKVSGMNR